jgi:dethiobiotin synthetase
MSRACFVTGTDTAVGKTVVAATIVAGLRADGVSVAARKPVITDVPERSVHDHGETADLSALPDHELLGLVSGESPDVVSPVRFALPSSPHLAAEVAGTPIALEPLVASLRETAARSEATVVEGLGGLLVPFSDTWDVRRLARELGWPVIIVARCGLGTLNHTLLTLEAARSAGLDVRAVVFTPWPAEPDIIEQSNRETIKRLGGIEVATLHQLAPLTRASLAGAARTLPYERWMAV